jgi:hypothetical protein
MCCGEGVGLMAEWIEMEQMARKIYLTFKKRSSTIANINENVFIISTIKVNQLRAS